MPSPSPSGNPGKSAFRIFPNVAVGIGVAEEKDGAAFVLEGLPEVETNHAEAARGLAECGNAALPVEFASELRDFNRQLKVRRVDQWFAEGWQDLVVVPVVHD
jgi:hypothetical protein